MPEPYRQNAPVVVGSGQFQGVVEPGLEADQLSEDELELVVGGLGNPYHSTTKSTGIQDGTSNTIMFGEKSRIKPASIKDGTSNTVTFGE